MIAIIDFVTTTLLLLYSIIIVVVLLLLLQNNDHIMFSECQYQTMYSDGARIRPCTIILYDKYLCTQVYRITTKEINL